MSLLYIGIHVIILEELSKILVCFVLIAAKVFLSCSSHGTNHMLGQLSLLFCLVGLYRNVSFELHNYAYVHDNVNLL